MNRILTLLGASVLAAVIGPAAAFTGSDLRMEETPMNRLDVPSLQRGARTFVNYCLNCHSAKYMRYNRLTDLGIDLPMIEDNLMFATTKVGETMTVAMSAADAKTWFGTAPPDLTVESRVRGPAWLYNYFLGFYKDDAAVTGWNNLVFPNVAMPHVSGFFGDQPARHHEFKATTRRRPQRSRPRGWCCSPRARMIRSSSRRWCRKRRARCRRPNIRPWSRTSSITSTTWRSPQKTSASPSG
jgi:hypothetical protein